MFSRTKKEKKNLEKDFCDEKKGVSENIELLYNKFRF